MKKKKFQLNSKEFSRIACRVTSKDWKEITFIAIAINISDNDDNFAHIYMQRTASWPN